MFFCFNTNGFTNNIVNNSKDFSEKMVVTCYDSKNGQTLIINKDKTVELYTSDKTLLYIKGTYTMTYDTTNSIGDEYFITITTTGRIINGVKYSDKYVTRFSLFIEDYKNMVMMNTIAYNIYKFYKIK